MEDADVKRTHFDGVVLLLSFLLSTKNLHGVISIDRNEK